MRIALLGLRCPLPDLVVSGVNARRQHGRRRHLLRAPSAPPSRPPCAGTRRLAFSVEQLEPGWLDEAVPILRAMVGHVIERGLPRHSILNVNLPDRPLAEITGIRPARLGGASAYDYVMLAGDDGAAPAEHYLPCDQPASGEWVETDFDVVASGAVAVTPLRYDLLDPALLADLAGWDLDLERLRDQPA